VKLNFDKEQRAAILEKWNDKSKYNTFTLDYLIKKTIEIWPDEYPKMVGIIASWKLE